MNRPNRSVYRRRIVGRSRWDSDYFDGDACLCVVFWEGETHARRLFHPTTELGRDQAFSIPPLFRGEGGRGGGGSYNNMSATFSFAEF